MISIVLCRNICAKCIAVSDESSAGFESAASAGMICMYEIVTNV